jgi:hypothetical protein
VRVANGGLGKCGGQCVAAGVCSNAQSSSAPWHWCVCCAACISCVIAGVVRNTARTARTALHSPLFRWHWVVIGASAVWTGCLLGAQQGVQSGGHLWAAGPATSATALPHNFDEQPLILLWAVAMATCWVSWLACAQPVWWAGQAITVGSGCRWSQQRR